MSFISIGDYNFLVMFVIISYLECNCSEIVILRYLKCQLNFGHTFLIRVDLGEVKRSEVMVVFDEISFALVYRNGDIGLVVSCCCEDNGLFDWNL